MNQSTEILEPSVQVTHSGLHPLDWTTLAIYLLAMLILGISFYKGQKTTRDFFLAGRSMTWVPVGLSLAATIFSAISYMAVPSVTQKYGVIYLAGAPTVFLGLPIVSRIFLPFYARMKLYSAYEYLEHRFDVRVRCLASGIFLLWRICWMSTALYAPSLALWAATGGMINLYVTIIALGVFATVYTALGGMKAVIWTDVIQFAVLFGGMILAMVWIVFEVPGGITGIFQGMTSAGKMSFVASIPEIESNISLFTKLKAYFCVQGQVTLLAVVISTFVGSIGFYTVDQTMVQRYLSTRSLQDARKAFWLKAISGILISICLTLLGMALFSYYATFSLPEQLVGIAFQSDWKYPYFIATAIPAGLAGILIAALYAATMSSVDSGINSCSAAFMVDFWQRLKYGEIHPSENRATGSSSEQERVWLARILTFLLGAIVTVLACFVGGLGDIIEITNKIVNSFCGPMFSIFLLGMLTRRAQSVGVCTGALLSVAVMGWLIFATDLNFLWPSTFGLVVALSFGYGISLFERRPDKDQLRWTFVEQRKLWKADTGE